MNKKLFYLALSVAAVGMTGCSSKVGEFKSEFFTTNPTPMVTVGENVPGVVAGNLPAKFIKKNAKVTITPVISWEGGSAKAQPTVIQGENVRANGQVVAYKTGGTVTIPFNVAYQAAMSQSDLMLEFEIDQKGKMYVRPAVKVGYGVVATSTLASAKTVAPAIAKDNFQRIINEKYSADIHFLINQANIRTNQTDAPEYIDLNKRLMDANAAPNQEIAGIVINSYASPDGTLSFNTELAEKRETNTTKYMENQLKKDKITEFGELTSSFTPEDWEGFQKLVEKSNIQDKDLILSVLKMYPDPEQREKEIRNLSAVFNELADQILPQLRYSRIMASINVIGKSDQELIELFNTDPKALTIDEILYVATLTNDNTKKMKVYDKAAELYPKDYRTFCDLGATQFVAGDYKAAQANFEQALRLNPSCKEADMNLGLVAMLNNNFPKAQELFGAASGISETANALGVYYIANGDLAKAVRTFGDAKNNNAALAQILNQDYTSAKATLAGIANPDAITYYLNAILGARTNNENMVVTNLRKAIKLDSALAARAQKDLEFAKFNLGNL